MKIAHFYYGAWNNFYHLSWPWRFLIELLVSVLILKYVLRLIKNIVRKLRLDLVLIKSWVWFVTEVVYLIGRNRNWAVEIDNRMIDWGEKAVNHTAGKKSAVLKKCMFVIVIIVYFSAVLVDDSVTLLGEFFQKIKRSTCFLCYNVITNKTYT